jgi:nicotinamidase-related amidase
MASDAPLPTAPARDRARGGVALLVVDMINCFDFAGGQQLRAKARPLVEPILRLRSAMDARDAPTIYVNDNFGEWHSEKSKLVERAWEPAREIVERIAPRDQDYFIIKPQFSGFYATNLPLLLPKLGVSRLVLTGIAADICILFTAADAHMRDYAVWVPQDAVAAEEDEQARAALAIMRSRLGAETAPSTELAIADWMASLDDKGIR